MGHETLASHYQFNFRLTEFHGYSLQDIGKMLPFEREVYLSIIAKYLKDKAERERQQS